MEASRCVSGMLPAGLGPARSCAAGVAMLAILLLTGLSLSAAAQTGANTLIRPGASIGVAPTVTGTAATQVAFTIEVGPPDALPPNCFLRVRGLPVSVSLSDGHAIAPGSWAVPLFSLPALKANLPAGQAGQAVVTLQLVSVDGAVLAEARTTLVISSEAPPAPPPPEAPPARTDLLAPSPAPAKRSERPLPVPRPPELSAEVRERAEKMLAQGDKFLDSGNIEIARQFYRRAADAGLAVGALRLAATYDPGELSRLKVQGVVASPADARRWYERARALGAPEAEERLVRLGQ